MSICSHGNVYRQKRRNVKELYIPAKLFIHQSCFFEKASPIHQRLSEVVRNENRRGRSPSDASHEVFDSLNKAPRFVNALKPAKLFFALRLGIPRHQAINRMDDFIQVF